MPNRKDLLLKRLLEEGQKTAAYYSALTDAQQAQQVYAVGPEWRARDLIGHLVSTERNIYRLLRHILKGGPGVPEGFDIDAFNADETPGHRSVPLADLVQQFEAARAATVALVQGLDEADLDRQGRHPFLGVAKLEEMIKLLYRHTMLHERDARRAIEAGQPVAGSA